jgi:hypothetical protein
MRDVCVCARARACVPACALIDRGSRMGYGKHATAQSAVALPDGAIASVPWAPAARGALPPSPSHRECDDVLLVNLLEQSGVGPGHGGKSGTPLEPLLQR